MAMLSALKAVVVQEETEKAVRRMQPSLNPAPDMAFKRAIKADVMEEPSTPVMARKKAMKADVTEEPSTPVMALKRAIKRTL